MFPLRPAVVLGIAALLAANLSLDMALQWYTELGRWGGDWASRILTGVVSCHTILLGIWLALSEGKWYWRLITTIPLTLGLAKALSLASTLANRGKVSNSLDWQLIAMLFLAIVLVVFVLLLPLRTLRSWRLSWKQYSTACTTQFSAKDLMLWMIPIGVALIAIKFVGSLSEGSGGLIELTLYTAGIAAVVWSAMLGAFSARRPVVALSYTVGFTLLVAGGYGITAAYQYITMLLSMYSGKLPPWYVTATLKEMVIVCLTCVVPAMLALVNFIVLRSLGLKLIRAGQPGLDGHAGLPSHSTGQAPKQH